MNNQDGTNYLYNEIGQLRTDIQSNTYIEYNLQGRVSKVREGTTNTSPVKAEYLYGPDGKRVRKTVYDASGTNWVSTWYAYDDGNLRGVYETSNACGGCDP